MIKEIENYFKENGIFEAKAEARLLVTSISGLSLEKILSGVEIEHREKIIALARKRVETKAPIQYIMGFAYFMGDKFFVNKDVLIPRPETELLVRAAIDEINKIFDKSKNINILDIGTGTGCIALEIAKNLPDLPLEIMGIDISTPALQTAINNMNELNQERRVVFRKSDIFSGLRPCDKFDIIVSNPPYIPLYMKESLQYEVKEFEPSLALFAEDNDGVKFYEKILKDAKNHLKNPSKTCCLLFEIGEGQAEIIAQIAEKYSFQTECILKDLSGINRVLCMRPF